MRSLISEAPQITGGREEADLRRLADSYLDHVLIALKAGDVAANLRDFLDPWWVFERGGAFVHRRRGGGYTAHTFNNPCPWSHRERLPRFDWVSIQALRIIEKGREAKIIDRKAHPQSLRLMADHAVPFAVIGTELWSLPAKWDRDRLRVFLRANFRRAILSYDEDRLLTSRGLRDRMPQGWRIGDDPFARYRDAGIEGTPRVSKGDV